MSKLREYLCIEAKTIERKDVLGYRFTSATKSAPEATMESVYLKSEVDKVIADLEESHKKEVEQLLMEIVELKADYKEACDRLQTANLIKDEQLAATRHQKYKRCLAMARIAQDDWHLHNSFYAMGHQEFEKRKCEFYEKWHKSWLEIAKKIKEADDGND